MPQIRFLGIVSRARGVAACRSGASAIEFGLIAPMIFFGFLSMVDVGRAIAERLALDGALRAGAFVAMSDPGTSAVKAAVGMADGSRTAGGERGTLKVDVQRFCACPEDTGTMLACTVTCAGTSPAAIYYSLDGSTTYDGLLLPTIELAGENRVRVR